VTERKREREREMERGREREREGGSNKIIDEKNKEGVVKKCKRVERPFSKMDASPVAPPPAARRVFLITGSRLVPQDYAPRLTDF